MKRLAVLSVLLCVCACGGDDGDDGGPATPQDMLIGTWNCTQFLVPYSSTQVDLMNFVDSITLSFAADGTFSSAAIGDTQILWCGTATSCFDSGTYTATEDIITLDLFGYEGARLYYWVDSSALLLEDVFGGETRRNISFERVS